MQRKVTSVLAVAGTAATVGILTACGGTGPSAPARHSTPAHIANAQVLSASAVAVRLQTQVPAMNHLVVFTASTDPNNMLGRQGDYTSKVQWRDSRAIHKGEAPYFQSMKSLGLHPKAADALSSAGSGVALGGSIEVYPSAAGAEARYRYIVRVNKSVPMIADGYDYVHGTAVLRLSKLSDARAGKGIRSSVRRYPVKSATLKSLAPAFPLLGGLGIWRVATVQGLSNADAHGDLHAVNDHAVRVVGEHRGPAPLYLLGLLAGRRRLLPSFVVTHVPSVTVACGSRHG
jgi:hypothetical protein